MRGLTGRWLLADHHSVLRPSPWIPGVMTAAKEGHHAIVEELVAVGADVSPASWSL